MGTGESATERGAALDPTTTIVSGSSRLLVSSAANTGSATEVIPMAITKLFILNIFDKFLSFLRHYYIVLNWWP
jgi:hypothetical protein